MSDLIVSVHVPKTGGVSFREALATIAEGRIRFDYDDRPLAPHYRWRALKTRLRRPSIPPHTRVVHGHFVAAKYWRVVPDARFVTWFRDPVERLASHYHYWLREPDPKNATCRRLIEQKLSLEAFAAPPEMRDVHARFLGGVPIEAFAFVGLTETFDESMETFRRLFCPDRRFEAGRHNANPARAGERYDLEPPLRAALERLNRADRTLYDRARARAEKLAAAPAPEG